jgi:hypothetical protein
MICFIPVAARPDSGREKCLFSRTFRGGDGAGSGILAALALSNNDDSSAIAVRPDFRAGACVEHS